MFDFKACVFMYIFLHMYFMYFYICSYTPMPRKDELAEKSKMKVEHNETRSKER